MPALFAVADVLADADFVDDTPALLRIAVEPVVPASRVNQIMVPSEDKVFWLGGSPCSGKTSITEILASRFDLDVYHVDAAFETHTQRLDPVHQPALTKWCESSWNQRWMQPIEVLVQEAIACYREHFALICEDILKVPKRKSLLVEGTALLPGSVASALTERSNAIWIVPSADFQRAHYPEREWAWDIVSQCSDPELAFHNWMERDVRFAEWVEAEATTLNLPILRVDGNRTLQENAAAVAAHFQW
jgi:2-phosphoglycerate kinase